MNRADISLLCLLALLWGGSFFFIEVAIRDFPVITVVWLRVALAAVMLGVACWVMYGREQRGHQDEQQDEPSAHVRVPFGHKILAFARMTITKASITNTKARITNSITKARATHNDSRMTNGATTAQRPNFLHLAVMFGLMGAFNNATPFLLIVWAQVHIDSGLAAIVNSMVPISTMLIAHFTTSDEKMSLSKGLAIILGMAGVIVLMGVGHLSALGGGVALLAQGAVVLATISYGIATVFGKRFAARNIPPMAVAFGQTTAAACLLFPVLLITHGWAVFFTASATAWFAVIGLAGVSTALAYYVFFTLLARIGATYLSLVVLLVPANSIVLGVVFLGEAFHWHYALGMALIAGGLMVMQVAARNTARQAAAPPPVQG